MKWNHRSLDFSLWGKESSIMTNITYRLPELEVYLYIPVHADSPTWSSDKPTMLENLFFQKRSYSLSSLHHPADSLKQKRSHYEIDSEYNNSFWGLPIFFPVRFRFCSLTVKESSTTDFQRYTSTWERRTSQISAFSWHFLPDCSTSFLRHSIGLDTTFKANIKL